MGDADLHAKVDVDLEAVTPWVHDVRHHFRWRLSEGAHALEISQIDTALDFSALRKKESALARLVQSCLSHEIEVKVFVPLKLERLKRLVVHQVLLGLHGSNRFQLVQHLVYLELGHVFSFENASKRLSLQFHEALYQAEGQTLGEACHALDDHPLLLRQLLVVRQRWRFRTLRGCLQLLSRLRLMRLLLTIC